MEPQTKKYLIYGTALVVVVGIGVVLWKKYQSATPSASTAATDQSNQDELALLAASLESNAYAGQGAASYSPTTIGAGVPQSLADEVLALEKALGFAPSSPTPTTPTTGGSSSPSTPVSGPEPTPSTPHPNPSTVVHNEAATNELIKYNHGSPIFEMDGVAGEGVLVS